MGWSEMMNGNAQDNWFFCPDEAEKHTMCSFSPDTHYGHKQ